jgi:hypothetical protein
MQHPYIVNANGHERHNQMLNEAVAHRRRKRVSTRKVDRDLLSELKARLPIFKDPRLDESASSPA